MGLFYLNVISTKVGKFACRGVKNDMYYHALMLLSIKWVILYVSESIRFKLPHAPF